MKHPGRVRLIEKGRLRPDPVLTVEDVKQVEESGLMDISLHPRFAGNRWVYLPTRVRTMASACASRGSASATARWSSAR